MLLWLSMPLGSQGIGLSMTAAVLMRCRWQRCSMAVMRILCPAMAASSQNSSLSCTIAALPMMSS